MPIVLLVADSSDITGRAETLLNSLSPHFKIVRLHAVSELYSAFTDMSPDVVVSVHSSEKINSIDLQHSLLERGLDIPHILIVEPAAEDVALQAVEQGAYDYVVSEHMKRLPIAVRRALEKVIRERTLVQQSETVTRDELALTSEMHKLLADNMSDMVALQAPGGEYLYVSPSCVRILGYTQREMYSISPYSIVHPDDIEKMRQSITTAVLRGDTSHNLQYRLRKKDNDYIWVETTSTSIVSASGEVEKVVSVTRNITLKKNAQLKLANSEANLRTLFEITDKSYLLVDRSFNILELNANAVQWTKTIYGTEGQPGVNLLDLLPDQRKTELTPVLNSVLEGNNIAFEREYPTSDGGTMWLSIKIAHVCDQQMNIIGLCISSRDITAQKLAEVERNTIVKELIQRTKYLEQFSYIVSHHLRAPIARIIGLFNVLKVSESLEEYQKAQELLLESTTQLEKITRELNNLLNQRNLQSENKVTFDLNELAQEVQQDLQYLISNNDATLSFDFSVIGHAKTIRGYLYGIFTALISNSIKFKMQGLAPAISIRSYLQNDKLVLSFRDNGMGFRLPEHEEKVFGMYTRFHPGIEGRGLGLFMVKSQLEIMGGDIHVMSEPMKGTEFIIELPL